MSVYAGPEISESGLVLSIDAANPKSYDSSENLLRHSQTFTSWTGGSTGVTANTTVAPDGTLTASTLVNPIDSTNPYMAATIVEGSSYRFSIFINSTSTAQWLRYRVSTASSSTSFFYDIINNVFGSLGAGFSNGVITNIGGNWRRISVTYTPAAGDAGTRNFSFMGAPVLGNSSGTVDTGKSVIVWGAQLVVGTFTLPYTRTEGTTKTRGTAVYNTANNNTGTMSNILYSNSSFLFTNSSTSIINFGTYAAADVSELTISAWVYPTGTGSGRFLEKVSVNGGYQFFKSVNNIVYASQPTATVFVSSGGLVTNTWCHIAVTQSANSASIYVNGLLNSTSIVPRPAIDSSTSLTIGNSGNLIRGFDGNMGPVLLFNRALSAAEIRQMFNALRGRFGL